jgi:dihydroxy-acid dehydratase
VAVSEAEMATRLAAWKQPKPRYTRGVLAKFAATVRSASEGAITDLDLDL